MVRECCICHAKKDKKASQSRIYFFEIPAEQNLYHDWANSIQQIKHSPYFLPKKKDLVCSKHFDDNCLSFNRECVELKAGSLPKPLDVLKAKKKILSIPVGGKENQPTCEVNQEVAVKNGNPGESGFELQLKTCFPTSKSEEDFVLRPGSKSPKLDSEDCPLPLSPASSLVSRESYTVETDGCDSFVRDYTPERSEKNKALPKIDVVHVDGQAIISFASPEDLQEYVDYNSPRCGVRKTRKRTSQYLQNAEQTSVQKKQYTPPSQHNSSASYCVQLSNQDKIHLPHKDLGSVSPSNQSLALEPDGTITADFAAFAISALVDCSPPPLIPLPTTISPIKPEQDFSDEEPDELPDLIMIPGSGPTILASDGDHTCNVSDIYRQNKQHESGAPACQPNFKTKEDAEMRGLSQKHRPFSNLVAPSHSSVNRDGAGGNKIVDRHQAKEIPTVQEVSSSLKSNNQEISEQNICGHGTVSTHQKIAETASLPSKNALSGTSALPLPVGNTRQRNVAKKHTHPIMRRAHLKKNQQAANNSEKWRLGEQSIQPAECGDSAIVSTEPSATQTEEPKQEMFHAQMTLCTQFRKHAGNNTSCHSANRSSGHQTSVVSQSKLPGKLVKCDKETEGPVAKPQKISKLRKIMQNPKFKLTKLVNKENSRSEDDTVNLTVRPNQHTFEVVAWVRLHRIYHAGKIRVRFLTRQNVPIILVMPPNHIVAPGISRDIKDLTKETNVPKAVKDLLNPVAPAEEDSLYAVLFCDGSKWELVGTVCYFPSPIEAAKKATEASQKTGSVALSENPTLASNQPAPGPSTVDAGKLLELTRTNSRDVPDATTSLKSSLAQAQTKLPSDVDLHLANLESDLSCAIEKHSLKEDLPILASSKDPVEQVPAKSPPVKLAMTPASNAQSILSVTIKTEYVEAEEYPEELYDSDDFYDSDSSDDMEDLGYVDNLISDNKKHEWELEDEDVEEDFENLDQEALEKRQQEIEEKLARIASKLSYNLPKVDAQDPLGDQTFVMDEEKCVVATQGKITSSTSDYTNIIAKTMARETAETQLKTHHKQKGAVVSVSPIASVDKLYVTEDSLLSLPEIIHVMAKKHRGSCESIVVKETDAQSQELKLQVVSKFPSPSKPSFGTVFPSKGSVRTTTDTRIKSPLPERTKTPDLRLSDGNTPPSCSSARNISPATSSQLHPSSGSKGKQAESQLPKLSNSTLPRLSLSSPPANNTALRVVAKYPPTLVLGNKLYKLVVFPKITSISSVQKKLSQTNGLSVKIEFEALQGEHKALCPSSACVTLPIEHLGDKWCMVAVDPLSKTGVSIPGMNVLIKHSLLEAALSAAAKSPSTIPLVVENLKSEGTLRRKFGIYAFPVLPRHIFLGPFSSSCFQDGRAAPCMKVISSPDSIACAAAEVVAEKRLEDVKAKLRSYNMNPDLVIEPVRRKNMGSETGVGSVVNNNRKTPREEVEISIVNKRVCRPT